MIREIHENCTDTERGRIAYLSQARRLPHGHTLSNRHGRSHKVAVVPTLASSMCAAAYDTWRTRMNETATETAALIMASVTLRRSGG